MDGLGSPLADDLPQVRKKALGMFERLLRVLALVLEGDLEAFVQVARDFEPLADNRRLELDLRENAGIGMEEDPGAAAARRSHLLRRPERLSLLEALLPFRAVTANRRDELFRKGIDDAGADAVEAAGGLVVVVVEFAARVQHGEDDLQRALLAGRVLVDRDTAPIVLDRDRRAVLVKGHPDVRGVPVHRLVYGVVEDLPNEMMQARAADPSDIHAGPATHGLEPFENSDVFCCVGH